MATYTPLVTLAGQSKIAAAIANNTAINILSLAVGDGNGNAITPNQAMTGLINEVDRVTVDSVTRDATDNTKVVVTATLPVNNGPYTIREMALFTDDGQMFAVSAYPETFKATTSQGATVEVQVQFVVQVASTAQVTIVVTSDTLLSIDGLLRVPFISVDGYAVNTPPSNPAVGALYHIGSTPTGSWATYSNWLAQWKGDAWAVCNAPVRTVIGDGVTGNYYRRTSTGWVEFVASETDQGLVKFASANQHKAGLLTNLAANPNSVARAIQDSSWVWAGTFGGTANALTCTLSPAPDVIGAGLRIVGIANFANTGPVTLAPNGKSGASVKYPNGAGLASGAWVKGQILEFHFDGTNYQLTSGGGPKSQEFKTGQIIMWPLDTPPAGTVECNGQSLSKTDYARLYAEIGDTYGSTSTTFKVPNYSGKFLRGVDHGAGNDPDAASRGNRGDGTSGDKVGTTQGDTAGAINLPNLPVTLNLSPPLSFASGSAQPNLNGQGEPTSLMQVTLTKLTGTMSISGNSGSTETRPKNVSILYAIAI